MTEKKIHLWTLVSLFLVGEGGGLATIRELTTFKRLLLLGFISGHNFFMLLTVGHYFWKLTVVRFLLFFNAAQCTLAENGYLKRQSALGLCQPTHLFSHFERYSPQHEIKDRCQVHLEMCFSLLSVLLDFQLFTKLVFECAFAHPVILVTFG